MAFESLTERDTRTDAFTQATAAASHAPSIHNTQPWRWRQVNGVLELRLEEQRTLPVTDPDLRLAILSCGAALQHARTALAALGWAATVSRLPDPNTPGVLARISLDGPTAVDPQAVRDLAAIPTRRTDRRPGTGVEVPDEVLQAMAQAADLDGGRIHILRPEQRLTLAAATDHAQSAEAADPEWHREMAHWTDGMRPEGAGIPDRLIPETAAQTTVHGRDFGHQGNLPVGTEHDPSAVFALLYGDGDEPIDWLRAGEAMAAAWLVAAERGVAVMPISAPVEIVSTRQILRRLISDLGYPYLVLRLRMAQPGEPGLPGTPRLSE